MAGTALRTAAAGERRVVRRDALASDRSVPRRPHQGHHRRAHAAERLLHRRRQRRRLEDDRLRPDVDADLRRPADRIARRDRGCAVGSERRLRRQRRRTGAAGSLGRRRYLHVDRRGQDLDASRPSRRPADSLSRYRDHRQHGQLPLHRRRQDVDRAAGAVDGTQSRGEDVEPAVVIRSPRVRNQGLRPTSQERAMRKLTLLLLVVAFTASAVARQAAPRRPAAFAPEGITPLSLGLAGYAKVLCSAVFVSERDPAEAFTNSGYFLFPDEHRAGVSYAIDRAEKLVRMTHGSLTRIAKFYGDQGCIIHPEGHDGIYFTPVPVKTRLPDAASQPWPMGDAPPANAAPTGIVRARVDKALDLAFADPEALTAAVVIVHKGQIVGERYMPGITKDTQLESWSMGKSLTATLFALLVKDGVYAIDAPVPVPEWRKPGGPRRAISD